MREESPQQLAPLYILAYGHESRVRVARVTWRTWDLGVAAAAAGAPAHRRGMVSGRRQASREGNQSMIHPFPLFLLLLNQTNRSVETWGRISSTNCFSCSRDAHRCSRRREKYTRLCVRGSAVPATMATRYRSMIHPFPLSFFPLFRTPARAVADPALDRCSTGQGCIFHIPVGPLPSYRTPPWVHRVLVFFPTNKPGPGRNYIHI
jgi:hypothetical protein